MSKLPAILRPAFPALAGFLDRRKQVPEGNRSSEVQHREAFDIERRVEDPSRRELEGWFKAAEVKGAHRQLKESQAEERARVDAIHERYAVRRHELALAYLNRGNKAIKWRYRFKRLAIIYGTIAIIGIVTGWVIASKFQGEVSQHPRWQNAIDR